MVDEAKARMRGVLFPTRMTTFARLDPPPAVADLVRWFWIPEWNLDPGRTSRQHLLAFPATNLVVEAGTAALSGPTTRASHRDLTGTGWAIGALLRPAAVPTVAPDPEGRRDRLAVVDHRDLVDAVTAAWDAAHPDDRHRSVVEAFTAWLTRTVPAPGDEALLANRLADLIETDETITRVEEVAAALHVSARTVQRLARSHIGLSPATMIRRRRLQAAAERVRTDPDADLASIAADLGYSDHAHLTREFRAQLGFTPTGYRRATD